MPSSFATSLTFHPIVSSHSYFEVQSLRISSSFALFDARVVAKS